MGSILPRNGVSIEPRTIHGGVANSRGEDKLEAAGSRYGVPLLSSRDALQCGLLDELGIEAVARKEVERWVRVPAG